MSPLRRKVIALGYRAASKLILLDDPRWRDPLVAALAPQPGERILDFGGGSARRALDLAQRFPSVHFVAVDLAAPAIKTVASQAVSRAVPNFEIATADANGRLPFSAGAFDKAISALAFHLLPPGAKIEMAREIWRVLRRGGSVFLANFDPPATAREEAVLRITRVLFGAAALEAHFDGTWPDVLVKAGFSGTRRLWQHSVIVARVGVVRARKL